MRRRRMRSGRLLGLWWVHELCCESSGLAQRYGSSLLWQLK